MSELSLAERLRQGAIETEGILQMNVESIGVKNFLILQHSDDQTTEINCDTFFQNKDEYSTLINSDFTKFEYSPTVFKEKSKLIIGAIPKKKVQRLIKRECKVKLKQELKEEQSTKSQVREHSSSCTKQTNQSKLKFQEWKKAMEEFSNFNQDQTTLIQKIIKFISSIKFQFTTYKSLAMYMRENSFYILKAIETVSPSQENIGYESLASYLFSLIKELIVSLTQQNLVKILLMSEEGTRWFYYLEKLLKGLQKLEGFQAAVMCWNLRSYLTKQNPLFLNNFEAMLNEKRMKQMSLIFTQSLELLSQIVPIMHPQYLMPFLQQSKAEERDQQGFLNYQNEENQLLRTRQLLTNLIRQNIFKLGCFSNNQKTVNLGDTYIGINANFYKGISSTQLKGQFLRVMLQQLIILRKKFSTLQKDNQEESKIKDYQPSSEYGWIQQALRVGSYFMRKAIDGEGLKEFTRIQNWRDQSLFKMIYSRAYLFYKEEFIAPKLKKEKEEEIKKNEKNQKDTQNKEKKMKVLVEGKVGIEKKKKKSPKKQSKKKQIKKAAWSGIEEQPRRMTRSAARKQNQEAQITNIIDSDEED